MMDSNSFNTFDEAEITIRNQVIDLCSTYSSAIKRILPTLKKAAKENKVTDQDSTTFKQLYEEANDHLHNLVQLNLEIDELKEINQSIILEISSEVLSNTVKFLTELNSTIGQTELYSEEETKTIN